MMYSEHPQRMEFNFEGQFLGFVSHDGKLKYMRLRMLSEELQIKLPKSLRVSLGRSLPVGEAIQVTGMGKFDRHTHELKLKAHQIIPLTAPGSQTPAAIPTSEVPSKPHNAKIEPKSKPKIKVLVCQKSGCLKKGGKGLGASLNQILRDRGLHQHVTIEQTGCLKHCSGAPNLVIMPGNHRYPGVRLEALPQIADAIAQNLARH
jgi:(2Fe-2S) ferredoxin